MRAAAKALRSGEPALLLLGRAGAARDAASSSPAGSRPRPARRMLAQTFNRRIERGAGRVSVERIPYPVEQALAALKGFKHIVLVGQPRAGRVLRLSRQAEPAGAEGHAVHHPGRRTTRTSSHALEWLADELGATRDSRSSRRATRRRRSPTGAITPATLAQSLGALIPENAIVVRRGRLDRPRLLPADAARASAHLAAEHGRLDRHRHAAGDRRGGRLPGPQGDQPPGRRQRDVHDAGAVDAGAREPRRHHGDLRQPLLRDPARTSWRTSARRMSAARRSTCSTSAAPTSTSSRWRAAWACRASASTTMDGFNTRAGARPGDAGAVSGRGDAGVSVMLRAATGDFRPFSGRIGNI